jgi:sugar-specific transcriptional regulator TrmB
VSLLQQEQLTKALSKLGMSDYHARVYSALVSLGPSGVAEIQRSSSVPRTKIYEVLQQLSALGAVEFQNGRPVVYNALSPEILVDRMRSSYLSAADEATRLLAEIHQTGKNKEEDLAWTVKGTIAVRRKAALTIASAKVSILMVEQYPPKLIQANASIIKSIQKQVNVRALCLVQEGQQIDKPLKRDDFIEFRRISGQSRTDSNDLIGEFKKPFLSIMSKASCLIVVDDIEAFISFPDRSDDSRTLGLTLRVPGVPFMQRLLFERVFQQSTTKAK